MLALTHFRRLNNGRFGSHKYPLYTPTMSAEIHNSQLLVLRAPNTRQAKHFVRQFDGGIKGRPYQNAKYFWALEESIRSLRDFYEAVVGYGESGDAFIVRGTLGDGVDTTRPVRRRLSVGSASDTNEYAIKPQVSPWLMIDIDKLALPDAMDVIEQTEQSIEYAVSQLPGEFTDASYIWQLSSSCGLFDTNVISVHLFFWLADSLPDEDLRLWADHTNIAYGSRLVDRAVFNPVQPHYIANPSFVGLDDPIIGPRLGFHEGSTPAVALNVDRELFVVKRDGCGVTGSPIEGIGYDAKMASLGDADGCKGFNDVLASAVASYVSSAGGDYAEQSRDDLKADIRNRIDAADSSNHSASEMARYLSDRYLDGLIDSAIEKFGSKDAAPPYWNPELLTLEGAEIRLRTAIDDFAERAQDWERTLDLPVLAIKATAGLGKTQSVIKQLLSYNLLEHGDVHYYIPTHKLSEQLLDDLNAELSLEPEGADYIYERARVIGGRSYKAANGQPLCLKHKVANKIASVGGNVYPLLCKNKDAQCEYFENCAYLAQMDDPETLDHDEMFKVLTEVKVMTHEHLFLRTKEQFLPPGLVIIDESFVRSAVDVTEMPVTDVLTFGDPDSVISAVGQLLLRQEPNLLGELRKRTSAQALQDELEKYESLHDNPFAVLDITASIDQQLAAVSKVQPSRIPLLIQTLASELTLADREVSHAVTCDGQTVRVHRRKALLLPPAPALMIDADADTTLLEPFFGHKVDIEEIAVERIAEVHQFSDRTFSKSSLLGQESGGELLGQVRSFIASIAARGQTLVVASKAIRAAITGEKLSEMGDESVYAGATLAHFNNLRGVNKYSQYQNVIVVGREQPSTTGLEEVARGIWYDSTEPLKLLDDVSGSKPSQWQQRGYRLSGGTGSTRTAVHSDWRVQALQEQIREAESTQAIDRLRLLRGHPEGLQRRVFILSSLPLDITVDHLWNWDAVQELLRVIGACNGVVPLNPDHLLAACPDLSSKPTAKRRVADMKGITSLIDILISNLILFSAHYRAGGQSKYSEVWYDSGLSREQLRERLSQLAGVTVTFKDDKE